MSTKVIKCDSLSFQNCLDGNEDTETSHCRFERYMIPWAMRTRARYQVQSTKKDGVTSAMEVGVFPSLPLLKTELFALS
jgi:hypothetical protein